jgi:hypothetical protein
MTVSRFFAKALPNSGRAGYGKILKHDGGVCQAPGVKHLKYFVPHLTSGFEMWFQFYGHPF